MDSKKYYAGELKKVSGPDLHGYKIKITGGYAETNWMNLNIESAEIVAEWLKKQYC